MAVCPNCLLLPLFAFVRRLFFLMDLLCLLNLLVLLPFLTCWTWRRQQPATVNIALLSLAASLLVTDMVLLFLQLFRHSPHLRVPLYYVQLQVSHLCEVGAIS